MPQILKPVPRLRKKVIRLDLEGERAKRGVELDSLERFIEALRTALRDFERSATSREYQIRRGGHPDARSMAVANFRLVGYKTGSAILEIEELLPQVDERSLQIPTEGAATQNVKNLLDAIDAGTLDPAVIDDLDEARRALGDDGAFGIKVPARRKRGLIDARRIQKLRQARAAQPEATHVTVFGRLHLIATEGTPRVEIRAADGYNWSCTFPPELEPQVLRLIKRQVRAEGSGYRERANRGVLRLEHIEPLPQYEQTALFSFTVVPATELEQSQGIQGPQGLSTLGIEDLPDDDAIDRYLAEMLQA